MKAGNVLVGFRFGKIDKGDDEKQKNRCHWFQNRPELAYNISTCLLLILFQQLMLTFQFNSYWNDTEEHTALCSGLKLYPVTRVI